MWRCMRNNKVSSQDENEEDMKVEHVKTSLSKLEPARRDQESMKKKVRFKTPDDRGAMGSSSDGNCTSGTRRIRLLVSKEELKRILSYKNDDDDDDDDAQRTSLVQLLSDVMLREKRTLSKVEEHDGGMNSWRPALESIPEDRSMK